MLIRKAKWDVISKLFSPAERALILGAKEFDRVWPEGFVVRLSALLPELRARLVDLNDYTLPLCMRAG